jgi:hypothetical protein
MCYPMAPEVKLHKKTIMVRLTYGNMERIYHLQTFTFRRLEIRQHKKLYSQRILTFDMEDKTLSISKEEGAGLQELLDDIVGDLKIDAPYILMSLLTTHHFVVLKDDVIYASKPLHIVELNFKKQTDKKTTKSKKQTTIYQLQKSPKMMERIFQLSKTIDRRLLELISDFRMY